MWLADLIPPAWKPVVSQVTSGPEFQALQAFLESEMKAANVLPSKERLFAALNATAPESVKIVLLGQDPYPNAGHANGLAFSVSAGVKVPASLKNLYAGLEIDLSIPRSTNGDISSWAQEGVLLLNTVLTVREGESNAHRKHGWETLTKSIVKSLAARALPTVFFCLGKPAQALVADASPGAQHFVLNFPHPSPLNGNAFVNEVRAHRPFTAMNSFLINAGRTGVSWQVEG